MATQLIAVIIAVVASVIGNVSAAVGQAQSNAPSPGADSTAVYSGVYVSTFQENIFSPCNVSGIGSGWSLRFTNPGDGAFLRYPYSAPGRPTLSHFVRVRGRVNGPGRYGLGFQTREIVVDSVLDISDSPQPCPSYEDLPQPWQAIPSSGARIIGTAVTDDRSRIAVLDLESIISIWDVSRGMLVRQFPSEDDESLSWGSRVAMEFTRDAKRLAVGGVDGVVRVWNPADGRRIWTLAGGDTVPWMVKGKSKPAQSAGLAFNQDGTLLANMVPGRTAIWSMTSGDRVDTQKAESIRGRFLFLGDSSFILSADSGLMKVYPRFGAAPIWRLRSPVQRFDAMERSPDGRWLLVKSSGDTAQLWSLTDGQPVHRLVIPFWFGRGAVAFSPDGNTIAMSGGANALYLWDTRTGLPVRSFQKYPAGVEKAWFTADGRSIVTHSLSDTVFRIVHFDSRKGGVGPHDVNRQPVQAWWGPHSWQAPPAPARTLSSMFGFVRDSSGKAIVGADVLIFDGDKADSKPIGRTSTNAAGRFLLQRIEVRHALVIARKRGFVTANNYAHLPTHNDNADFILRAIKP